MDRHHKIILVIIFLLIFILSLFLRFSYLTADLPPLNEYGTPQNIEGHYIHNARNKVLFGNWYLEGDLYNPILNSPIFSYSEFISFSIFGINTFSARIMPAIFGVISILIVSLLYMVKKFEQGFIYFYLLLS